MIRVRQFELEEKLRINSILLLNGIRKYRQMLEHRLQCGKYRVSVKSVKQERIYSTLNFNGKMKLKKNQILIN